MITPSYSLTAQQTVSPKLALDFTTASLDSRITFTRSGNTATVTNSSGAIVGVNADIARFDYDPVTLACKGLLIEESRINLLTYSAQFENVNWTKTACGVTANATTAPDGAATGDKLIPDNTNSTHTVAGIATVVSGTAYTFSVYLKAGEETVAWLWNNVGGATASFNLSAGTATGQGTIRAAGNGWYRCSIPYTPGGVVGQVRIYIRQTTAYVGDNLSGLYAWGGQLEVGAFATSYIPTVALSVTRNADVAVMTGTNFSNWYNATQGTFKVNAITPASGARTLISADDNTASNSLTILTNGTAPKFVVTQSTTEQANVTAGTITANTAMFAYSSYASNYFGIARPSARQVDTSGTVPTVNRLRIGADQAGNYADGHLQAIQFWP